MLYGRCSIPFSSFTPLIINPGGGGGEWALEVSCKLYNILKIGGGPSGNLMISSIFQPTEYYSSVHPILEYLVS